jgi:light-regulated signal transduction histidine kinase (bacteriophytochrome)
MISSYLQLLESRYRGHIDSDADEFIKFAVDGAARMQALINDLLAYSRVGRLEQPRRSLDTAALVDQVLATFATRIKESGAQVTVDRLPTIEVEAGQLRQVFQNLVSNALKFTNQAPPRIHISAERSGDEWRISVEDNCIPIAPQHRERIFNMFQRLHSRGDYTGTGVGLAICKKIVERHGGTIWVDEGSQGGNTFRFTIPDSGDHPAGQK